MILRSSTATAGGSADSTHFRSPHRPSDHSLHLLDLYARQAADFIDRFEAEEQLRQSEQQLKSLSDIAPGIILWASAPGGARSFVTHGWSEYTGQPAERALGDGWLESVHDDDRERVQRAFADANGRRETFSLDHRMRRADGEFRWVLAAGRSRRDERGKYLGLVGSVIDVHERKLAENALRDSEAILAGQKEAFQAAMDGRPLVACLDALVRTAVAQYTDARAAFYMVGDDRGLHHVTGMSDEYARQIDGFKIGPESLACGLALHSRQPVITPDVEEEPRWEPWRWMAREHDFRGCWSFPVQTSGGPILGTLALYFPEPRTPARNDLSLVAALAHAAAIVISKYDEAKDRARAEQALKESNRRKDEFLAVLGHELRNPLAPLSTAAELLKEVEKKPELLETVRPMMRRQIDHLARLVDDLLDASRISRGYAELQQAPFELRSAVESAVEQSKPLIAARRHRLNVELVDAPLRTHGDFQRLTQVFVNLLSNAAKYSEPGGEITVRAIREGDQAFVRVTDRGFGIPPDRVQEIFEMFSQVAEHRSLVGGGGLGIGLALCRQLVELHGGSIAAKSEGLGCGSEFTVRLPLAPAAREEAGAPAEKPAAESPRRRVLVVDDNVDAAATLRMALELQGHEARAVFGGVEALEAMAQRDAEIVLLDLGMPQMDGFEVARRIRQLPGGRDVLLVALTGWGQDQDRARTADGG
jgi:PAS domain S-box-containing protein